MSQSYFGPEKDLLEKLDEYIQAGQIIVSSEFSMIIWSKLLEAFPFRGSTIDWSLVPDSLFEIAPEEGFFDHAHQFFERVKVETKITNEDLLTVIGDNSESSDITLPSKLLDQFLNDFLWMPQHTYVVPNNMAWCMSCTMTGHLGFGFKPS